MFTKIDGGNLKTQWGKLMFLHLEKEIGYGCLHSQSDCSGPPNKDFFYR